MSLRFTFNESVEVFNLFALVTISKNSWRIVNTCFYQVTKKVKWDNFALRRRKLFFKWFNYADSGTIIISYISLHQQQKRNVFFQKWKFCKMYSSTKNFKLWDKMTIRNYKTFQVSFQFCSFVTNERHFLT